MSYADVFGGQGSPQWVTLATGVGGKSQTVPARSMSGYRFRNMSGCVVQLVVDGTLQDEFEPYSEGSGYLGYPGQPVQQVQYLVQNGDPVELSNYAIASWRCLVELVPVDLPYQRVRMSATITGTVQLAPGTSINVGNSPTVLQGGGSPWQTGNIREYLAAPAINGTFSTLTLVATQAVQNYHTMLFVGSGQSLLELKVTGHTTGLVFFDAPIAALQLYPVPLLSALDTSLDFWIRNGATGVSIFLSIYSISSAGPVLPLTNYGGAPLTVQPASGSQQLVVPGAAASSVIAAAATNMGFTRTSLGLPISMPATIYGITWTATCQNTTGSTGNTTGQVNGVLLGIKGVTSNKELWLAGCGLALPATSLNSIQQVASDGGSAMFAFPLSMGSLLPTDTQVQPQLAYSGAIAPLGALALIG